MDLEKAIKKCTAIVTTKFNNDYSIDSVDKEAIETVLQALGNSIPKKKVEDNIKELKKKKDLSPFGMGKLIVLQELLKDK